MRASSLSTRTDFKTTVDRCFVEQSLVLDWAYKILSPTVPNIKVDDPTLSVSIES